LEIFDFRFVTGHLLVNVKFQIESRDIPLYPPSKGELGGGFLIAPGDPGLGVEVIDIDVVGLFGFVIDGGGAVELLPELIDDLFVSEQVLHDVGGDVGIAVVPGCEGVPELVGCVMLYKVGAADPAGEVFFVVGEVDLFATSWRLEIGDWRLEIFDFRRRRVAEIMEEEALAGGYCFFVTGTEQAVEVDAGEFGYFPKNVAISAGFVGRMPFDLAPGNFYDGGEDVLSTFTGIVASLFRVVVVVEFAIVFPDGYFGRFNVEHFAESEPKE